MGPRRQCLHPIPLHLRRCRALPLRRSPWAYLPCGQRWWDQHSPWFYLRGAEMLCRNLSSEGHQRSFQHRTKGISWLRAGCFSAIRRIMLYGQESGKFFLADLRRVSRYPPLRLKDSSGGLPSQPSTVIFQKRFRRSGPILTKSAIHAPFPRTRNSLFQQLCTRTEVLLCPGALPLDHSNRWPLAVAQPVSRRLPAGSKNCTEASVVVNWSSLSISIFWLIFWVFTSAPFTVMKAKLAVLYV